MNEQEKFSDSLDRTVERESRLLVLLKRTLPQLGHRCWQGKFGHIIQWSGEKNGCPACDITADIQRELDI
jgi:hypothetical protein